MVDFHSVAPGWRRLEIRSRSDSRALIFGLLALFSVVLILQTGGGISPMDNLLQTIGYSAPQPTYYRAPIYNQQPSTNTPVYAQAYAVNAQQRQQTLEDEPAGEVPPAEPAAPVEQPASEVQPPAAPEAPVPQQAPPAEPAPADPANFYRQPLPPPPPQQQQYPSAYPQQYPPGYQPQYPGQNPSAPSQYPSQYPHPSPDSNSQIGGIAPSAVAPCAQPCSNPTCDKGPLPGGCLSTIPTPPGWTCTCPPPPPKAGPAPLPAVGSEAWMQLPNNQYGRPLGINASDADLGMQVATYESGQVAYQLSRYLRHKANNAKVQAMIEDVVLKDLQSAQPCRLVKGGPGGFRCATSATDQGDEESGEGGGSGSGTGSGSGSGAGSADGKGGIFGLGFLGL